MRMAAHGEPACVSVCVCFCGIAKTGQIFGTITHSHTHMLMLMHRRHRLNRAVFVSFLVFNTHTCTQVQHMHSASAGTLRASARGLVRDAYNIQRMCWRVIYGLCTPHVCGDDASSPAAVVVACMCVCVCAPKMPSSRCQDDVHTHICASHYTIA